MTREEKDHQARETLKVNPVPNEYYLQEHKEEVYNSKTNRYIPVEDSHYIENYFLQFNHLD